MSVPAVRFSKHKTVDERFAVLDGIELGDQIDILSILGRKANKIVIVTSDTTDEVVYTLNTLVKRKVLGDHANRYLPQTKGMIVKEVEYWGTGTELRSTGKTVEITMPGISFSSLEIVGLTLDTGSTVQVTLY